MTQRFIYPTVVEAIAVHSELKRLYGGADGIRDAGLLEAALYRPQTGYYEDVYQEAAALMESLTINHCFIDGNKRVAFAMTDIFLRINVYRFIASSNEIYRKFMELFDAGKFEFIELEKYLRGVVDKA